MLRRIAEGFLQSGYSVDLVLARATGPNLAAIPVNMTVVDFDSAGLMKSLRPLARYLELARPDALIATPVQANLVSVMARAYSRFRPTLILREANTLSVSSADSRDPRDRLSPRLASVLYPRADAVVAVSKGVADDLVVNMGVPQAMVRVIYNPTVGDDIERLMNEPLADAWFHDEGAPVVLSVGRLAPQKRFDDLIRAVWFARQKRPVRLMIIGEGEERPRLQALAASLGIDDAVRLPGFIQNPYAYMARAHLYAVSSAYEGLPNTIIEALACGLPVVSTDCPSGPREILTAGGSGGDLLGALVPVGRPEELGEAILGELSCPPNRVRLQSRARRFTMERAVRAYMDLLSSTRVIGRGGA